MAQTAVAVVLEHLRSGLLSRGIRVERLILFGSQARGTAREDSDIDVAVISPDFRDKDIFERVRITAKAGRETIRKFLVPLEMVFMTPEEYESGSSPLAAFVREGDKPSVS